MDLGEIQGKLAAIRNAAAKKVENPRSRYFDPPAVLDLFGRYVPLRDALRVRHPDLFGDLPVRDVKSSGTSDHEGRGYIDRWQVEQLIQDIEYSLDLLSHAATVKIPEMKVTREGIFFAGQYFDALQHVSDIIASAQTEIVVIDGYIAVTLLSLLTAKKSGVEVRILTKSVPADVQTAATAFNKQYGGLSIRTSNAFHDRFVIIDGKDFYHFGASIKDLGSKGFMFSRIEEQEVTVALRKKWEEEWQRATPVV
jgi:hypothetical protein